MEEQGTLSRACGVLLMRTWNSGTALKYMAYVRRMTTGVTQPYVSRGWNCTTPEPAEDTTAMLRKSSSRGFTPSMDSRRIWMQHKVHKDHNQWRKRVAGE